MTHLTTKDQFGMDTVTRIRKIIKNLLGVITIITLHNSCNRMNKTISSDMFVDHLEKKITLMGNSEINGWRLICRPETVGKGQYVCIYSTCEYSDDSCWFSVIHDFNNEKTPFYKPSIRDSTNLCRAWGVDKTDILHYSDSVITTCLSPIVKQITTGYAIDEMSFGKVSWFSSAVNGWTVSIISDTNGVFLVKSATHKPSDDTR